MKVALIAAPFISVPPADYGGTELFVAHLAEGLSREGIQVIVYGNGESTIKTELRSIYPHSEWPIKIADHHGIDVSRYRLVEKKQQYLSFIGRIAPIKGTHLAIDVARRTGLPLKIAGEVQPVNREYSERKIKPEIDGNLGSGSFHNGLPKNRPLGEGYFFGS